MSNDDLTKEPRSVTPCASKNRKCGQRSGSAPFVSSGISSFHGWPVRFKEQEKAGYFTAAIRRDDTPLRKTQN